MANMNKVILAGNLTKDPELRYTPAGMAVTDLGLAVNDVYTKDGEKQKRTLFIDVTVWARQAENCCEYLAKGRSVLVEGRLQMDTWEGQDGQKRSKIRVVAQNVQFLSPRGEGGGRPASSGAVQGGGAPEPGGPPPMDDDIPF